MCSERVEWSKALEAEAPLLGAEAGAGRPGRCTEDARCAKAGVPVLVELLQDHNRRLSKDLLTIDFRVFKVVGEAAVAAVDAGERLSRLQLQEECEQEAQTGSEEACSAAHAFCHLQHCARYVVVPHTGEPGERRRFLLRVFARNAHLHLRLLQDQAQGQDQDQAQEQDQDQGQIQAQEQTQL